MHFACLNNVQRPRLDPYYVSHNPNHRVTAVCLDSTLDGKSWPWYTTALLRTGSVLDSGLQRLRIAMEDN